MADYLNIIYDQKSHPKTSYPEKLVKYLFNSFKMEKGQIFLEPGCGRGEFLNEFNKLGLKCHGIDSKEDLELCKAIYKNFILKLP